MRAEATRRFTAWHRCGWKRGGIDDARDFLDYGRRPAFRRYVDGWSNAHLIEVARTR